MTVWIFMDNYPKIITKYQSTVIQLNYSKIPILRPPFGLPESALIRGVVLILNKIS